MPAKAPRPGAGKRIAISQELKQAEKDWIRVECERDGKNVLLWHSSIGPHDERLCKGQAGVSIWEAINTPTEITNLAAIYWMARRKNGESDLTFRQVVKELPDLQAVIDAGFALEFPDPDGEDDEEDADDEPADPTSSGEPSETTGPPGPSTSASTPGTSAATRT